MTTHIMLDLETWGRKPGADIRSIGAVVFDPTAEYGAWVALNGQQTFYVACDNPTMAGIYRYNLTRETETVQWWSEQSEEAQAAFSNPVDLWKALYNFRYWLWSLSPVGRFEVSTPDETVRIWANDPHFDVSILAAAFDAVRLQIPWHYRAPRSFRTVVELSGMSRDDMQQFNTGTTHNALDDAISQAKIVCEAYKRLGLNK